MKGKVVLLTVTYQKVKNLLQRLVTNANGVAEFSLDTQLWGTDSVSFQVGEVFY